MPLKISSEAFFLEKNFAIIKKHFIFATGFEKNRDASVAQLARARDL